MRSRLAYVMHSTLLDMSVIGNLFSVYIQIWIVSIRFVEFCSSCSIIICMCRIGKVGCENKHWNQISSSWSSVQVKAAKWLLRLSLQQFPRRPRGGGKRGRQREGHVPCCTSHVTISLSRTIRLLFHFTSLVLPSLLKCHQLCSGQTDAWG